MLTLKLAVDEEGESEIPQVYRSGQRPEAGKHIEGLMMLVLGCDNVMLCCMVIDTQHNSWGKAKHFREQEGWIA